MRALLLGAAAPFAVLALAPAQAQPAAHPVAQINSEGRNWEGRDGRHGRDGAWHNRRRGPAVVIAGPWGWQESRDFDGNRSFDADRWNDWWHERTNRSYPRWVQEAPPVDCDRLWWGGGAWRCAW